MYNIKIENGHLVELKERNTLEQFSALCTAWLKRFVLSQDLA